MPVPHELTEDFPAAVERIRALRESDAHFRRLAERYEEINRAVHRAEERLDPMSEEEEEKLRRERMRLKDDLARMLG